MASRRNIAWKCLHLLPQDISSAYKAHVVGFIPDHTYLEVAVPIYTPITEPYKDLPSKPSVSIESQITKESLHEHGPLLAYYRAHFDFVENARHGIAHKGASLATYYRERYPSMTPWIEYIMLLDTLSVCRPSHLQHYDGSLFSTIGHRTNREKGIKIGLTIEAAQVHWRLSQAIVFISLSLAPADDQLWLSIADMDPVDIINRLCQGLEDQYKSIQPDPNFIVMIRMLLYSLGITNHESTMGLLSHRELNLVKAVYTLLGGTGSTKLKHVIDNRAFMQRLSCTQVFRGCPLDDALIDQYTQKFGIGLWSSMSELPNHWVSGLSEDTLHSMRQLWDDTCDLDPDLIEKNNLERIFATSACLDPKTRKANVPHPTLGEMEEVFLRASQSLMQTTTITQMALDLMTMKIITQRYSPSETNQPSGSPFTFGADFAEGMEDYEHFQHLALRPHTKTSLALLSAATRVAHKRFENCTSGLLSTDWASFPPHQLVIEEDVDESIRDLGGPVDESWTELVNKLSQLERPPEGSRITQSMWHLARGGHLDFGIVEDYLQLLRSTSHHVEIAQARMLRHDQNGIQETEGIAHPVIIPFFHENNWAFAVAYSDCVHWYDSTSKSASLVPPVTGARHVVEGWRGPQNNNLADSGVFMLMGIKLMLQRKPHLSQSIAVELNQSFRACIFVELACQKVQPTSTDLHNINLEQLLDAGYLSSTANLISHGHALIDEQQESSFFEDAMVATIGATRALSSVSPALCQAEESDALSRNPDMAPATDPDRPLAFPSSQPRHLSNTSRKRRLQPKATGERTEGSPQRVLDDRKVILDNLSHGIHFKRSARVSFADDPVVLRALLRYSRTSGNLHRRYHAVLFHLMMEDRDRKIRMESAIGNDAEKRIKRDLWSCNFWKKVSDIGERHGLGKWVSLCAFENDFSGYRLSEEAQGPLIERLEERLGNKTDMLHTWLQDARGLCEVALAKCTPVASFNIDKYNFQAEFDMTEDQFRFYVCSEVD
ncbi:hypothetical protein FAGAP_970 [Fusarium agapanthi]|uniref:Uncharacterized protein n=1 Tax=Fusarium agapanthi TaxID=1803897 RepID=A0A9P5BIS3_9HYPO|nr:hypothetical protein FAGAP_970 [Fusarium agapanthi]